MKYHAQRIFFRPVRAFLWCDIMWKLHVSVYPVHVSKKAGEQLVQEVEKYLFCMFLSHREYRDAKKQKKKGN